MHYRFMQAWQTVKEVKGGGSELLLHAKLQETLRN